MLVEILGGIEMTLKRLWACVACGNVTYEEKPTHCNFIKLMGLAGRATERCGCESFEKIEVQIYEARE